MLSLTTALLLILIFFGIESSLRYGKEAKSWAATEKDKKSTSYLFRLTGVNFIALLFAFLLNHFKIGVIFNDSMIALWGNALMIVGLLVRITATRTLKEYYTRTLKIQKNQKIVEVGLYKYLRHPGYLGVIMLWVGAGLSSNNYIVLVIISAMTLTAYHYRISSEEKMLTDAFGEDYVNYKKRTWRLIPFIY